MATGINIRFLKDDGKSSTMIRTGIDGTQVGGRIHSGGSTPKSQSWNHQTFKDPKTGKTLTGTVIGD